MATVLLLGPIEAESYGKLQTLKYQNEGYKCDNVKHYQTECPFRIQYAPVLWLQEGNGV